jgi:hypothetical protein
MMLAFDESVVMDTLTVISRANVTLHGWNSGVAERTP